MADLARRAPPGADLRLGRREENRARLRAGAIGFTLAAVNHQGRRPMVWTTPTLVEICIGLEINGYLPAEF